MLHLPCPRAARLALLAVPLVAAPAAAGRVPTTAAGPGGGPAHALPAAAPAGPAGAATAYLRLRAGCLLAPAAGRALTAACLPGAPLAGRELLLAAGGRRLAAQLGHRLIGVSCRVTVGRVRLSVDGRTATVGARAVTIVTWAATDGRTDTEGDGIDHVVVLVRRAGRWLVAADRYTSDLTPRLLQAAGASRAAVADAARRLESASAAASPLAPAPAPAPPAPLPAVQPAQAATPAGAAPGYVAKLSYDRAAAKAYADRYALSYNPTYVSFSSDCANFGSQVMYAGGYPQFGSAYATGWWYDKSGTSTPADDSYSHPWIAVANQQAAWNARYTDVVSAVSDLSAGDFVYYDWTGNGTWDHVAELVGTNSAGQRVVDAHTTDHYHVYWKLGTSATHYRFVHTRATIVI